MQTSDPNIYAVGDAVEVKDIVNGDNALYPLAGPANKQVRYINNKKNFFFLFLFFFLNNEN